MTVSFWPRSEARIETSEPQLAQVECEDDGFCKNPKAKGGGELLPSRHAQAATKSAMFTLGRRLTTVALGAWVSF